MFLQRRSRTTVVVITLALVAIVGAADYLSGFERSLLAFYLIPVGIAAWFAGSLIAALVAVISVATWIVGDVAAGARYSSLTLPIWNGVIALLSFLVVIWLLTRLRLVLDQLEKRVSERTAALQEEIAKSVQLEEDIADVTERERRRLGHELHDSVCQHLTGTSLAAQVLSCELADAALPQARSANKVVALIESAIDLTRNLARGLISLELESEGLCGALRELAHETTQRYTIGCVCHCDREIAVRDSTVATHLFRIAQEAITNACRHSEADEIVLGFGRDSGKIVLSVEDDGIGLARLSSETTGLGLRVMKHRAALIRAEFSVGPRSGGGTIVSVSLVG